MTLYEQARAKETKTVEDTEPRPVCMYRGCEVPPELGQKFCAFHPFTLNPKTRITETLLPRTSGEYLRGYAAALDLVEQEARRRAEASWASFTIGAAYRSIADFCRSQRGTT